MNVNNTGDNMDQQTTGPDCLNSDLAGLAAREAGAPARAPTRIEEIRGRLTPKRAEDAAAWDPDADGCVCAECMKGIRLLEGFEWTNGEDVCDECAVALIGHLRADAGYLLNELAGYQSDLLAGERALKEARRERDTARSAALDAERAFEAMRAERDELLGKRVSRVVYDSVCEERDTLTADLARARHILAVEQGREGPEGWTYDFGQGRWVGGTNVETAYVTRMPWVRVEGRFIVAWSWDGWRGDEHTEGLADTALGAIEAAERALKGP